MELYFTDADQVLVGKPEGKIPLGRPKRRCETNTLLKLILNWTGGRGLGQSSLVGCREHGNGPYSFHKRQGIILTISFSRRSIQLGVCPCIHATHANDEE